MNLQAESSLLQRNIKLAAYSTMHVGGVAEYFALPKTEKDLTSALAFARERDLRVQVLGKGSNVIFSDDRFHGLVVCLIHFDKDRIELHPHKPLLTASSGVALHQLALAARDLGVGGLEFLASVPGTVGGSVVMNAGYSRFHGQINETGDLVESVKVIGCDGRTQVWGRDRLHFGYRSSNIGDFIVLEVTFRLWRRHPSVIAKEISANFEYRNRAQDVRYPSSGSVFKNPGGGKPTAGILIELAGLKGLRVGAIEVSPMHGNFFVNLGKGTAHDFEQLMREVQRKVLHETGISLEPEVRFIQGS
ncbi:MAG: UDP-N-acetylmuramate dehydrogenase [Candidatus Omnitrophota bacterium]|nr:UDP-N-acetylmuramate dehydrogenase [Candidatus Omnitrophota bacterium]